MPDQVSVWWLIGSNLVSLITGAFSIGWITRGVRKDYERVASDAAEALSIATDIRTAHGLLAIEVGRHDERLDNIAQTIKAAVETAFAQGARTAWHRKR